MKASIHTAVRRLAARLRNTALMSAVGLVGLGAWLPTEARALDLTPFEESLAKYQQKPEFNSAGPAFDAEKCMKGKCIFSIPVSSENTFTAAIETQMQAIAAKVGFKFTTWENQGAGQRWAQGMNAAITRKASLIDLLAGSDPRTLVP